MTFPQVLISFKRSVTIKRRQAGSYVNHVWVEAATVDSPLIGSFQPATPEELKSKPEGEEFTAGLKGYIDKAYVVNNGDVIVDGSDNYRVFSVLPWKHHGYNKMIAGLIDA